MAGAANPQSSRPLSPHLQVWRWHVTLFVSILHRITGAILFAAAALLVVWLGAIALGPRAYDGLMSLLPAWLIQAKIAAAVFVLAFHLANGVRHLFWDFGAGFRPATANMTAWLVILVAFAAPAALLAWLNL